MSDISLETARKTVSVFFVHEMQKLVQRFASHSSSPLASSGAGVVEQQIQVGNIVGDHTFPGLSIGAGDAMLKDLLKDPDLVDALRVLILEGSSEDQEWVSMAEAQSLLGFSRTYMIGLLDSHDFKDAVFKSRGGHRRVSRRALEEWKVKNGVPPASNNKSKRQQLRGQIDMDIELNELRRSIPDQSGISEEEKKFQEFRARSLAAVGKKI